MRISPFFHQLRSAYQAEMDDLTFDSEGKDVLRQRLSQRRKELGFLLKMIELSPEMVAVTLHQGFRFKSPAALESVLAAAADEVPNWNTLSSAIELAPWTRDLVDLILKEPKGAWFLTVAAALEFMYSRPHGATTAEPEEETDEDSDNADDDAKESRKHRSDDFDADDDTDDRPSLDEAGADWLADQGFERKE